MSGCRIVRPNEFLELSDLSPEPPKGTDKDAVEERRDALLKELGELEDLLFFASRHSVLLVFQGMDTAGKDGAIRRILAGLNSLGVRVAGFKRPTEEELGHDFLWRVHRQTPRRGDIVLFNRSHYEDVLVVRVHGLAPPEAIEGRYGHINAFERLLLDNDTILLKFFLHISKDEQKRRLLEREEQPETAWKLAAADWKEREHWDAYQEAYALALARCSPPEAPWRVVPAEKKWYRDFAVLEALVEALRPYRQEWNDYLDRTGARAKAELAEYRKPKA
ncbi:MAG: hypothetical protein KIS66_03220 [Fimbriimonadaceae bacterium]|nr:hypothetical protein [Fimbriimonadaceae bacterium]